MEAKYTQTDFIESCIKADPEILLFMGQVVIPYLLITETSLVDSPLWVRLEQKKRVIELFVGLRLKEVGFTQEFFDFLASDQGPDSIRKILFEIGAWLHWKWGNAKDKKKRVSKQLLKILSSPKKDLTILPKKRKTEALYTLDDKLDWAIQSLKEWFENFEPQPVKSDVLEFLKSVSIRIREGQEKQILLALIEDFKVACDQILFLFGMEAVGDKIMRDYRERETGERYHRKHIKNIQNEDLLSKLREAAERANYHPLKPEPVDLLHDRYVEALGYELRMVRTQQERIRLQKALAAYTKLRDIQGAAQSTGYPVSLLYKHIKNIKIRGKKVIV